MLIDSQIIIIYFNASFRLPIPPSSIIGKIIYILIEIFIFCIIPPEAYLIAKYTIAYLKHYMYECNLNWSTVKNGLEILSIKYSIKSNLLFAQVQGEAQTLRTDKEGLEAELAQRDQDFCQVG